METLKQFVLRHFEEIIVAGLAVAIVVLNYFVVQKLAFLNLFFLPVLVSGYALGRRSAVLISFLSVLLITFYAVVVPNSFFPNGVSLVPILNLVIWGSFLLLAGIVVGTLYEEKEKKIQDLKTAYIGVLEILAKYLDASDRYTKGHSVRVADLAVEIAIAMELPRAQIENIRAAGLLHDIGKMEISSDLIKKAAELSHEEKEIVDTHARKGAELLGSVGGVLKEAIPIILAHHEYYTRKGLSDQENLTSVPLGGRIIAVADAYDAIITDRPYRRGKPPWEAIEEIEKHSGTQFDPQVVEAFSRVVASKLEEG